MSDKTGISWTDATAMVDRDGRRTRLYARNDPSRPGQQLRRRMAGMGLKWCRRCEDWLPSEAVTKNGLCRPHENEDYRRRYADGGRLAIAARIHARDRKMDPIPAEAREAVECFENACAYCGGSVDGFDHIIPVSAGGRSVIGNLVPACKRCNSSKGDRPLLNWAADRGRDPELIVLVAEWHAGITTEAL
jgi:5-methylcytosine-specific restriction endonuclease McrA